VFIIGLRTNVEGVSRCRQTASGFGEFSYGNLCAARPRWYHL